MIINELKRKNMRSVSLIGFKRNTPTKPQSPDGADR